MALSFVVTPLSPSMIALSVASALLLYLCGGAVLNYFKLRQFKGPLLAAVSEVWLWKQSLAGNVVAAQAAALQNYGSPARIAPNLLITDDAELLRHMSAPRSRWTRGQWYEGMKLDPKVDNVFSTRNEKRHAEMRAKEIAGYSGKDVENLETEIDEQVLALMKLIKRECHGKVLDFARLAQYFTLDVLSKVAFGAEFGYMEANEDLYDYNKASADFMPVLEWILNHGALRNIMTSRLIQALAAPKGTDKIGQGRILGIAQKAVAERYGSDPKVKRDMLGSFVAHGLTQEEAESESHLQIMAGSDSTSTTMRVTFTYILGNPMAYAKLRAEIETAIAEGSVSHPVIKFSEAQKLPYLQACIWEGLRMWPPLVGLQSKLAPPEGETVNGVFFPPGTEIATCPSMVTRNKKIFGSDADIFRPERWLEADTDTRAKFERTTDVIFGSGRFVCLGRKIAMLELNKVFVELLRNYDWALADPIKGADSVCWGIYIQSNMNVSAWPRPE